MLSAILQIIIVGFGCVCVALMVLAVIEIYKSADFRYKPLWYLAVLFGFFGISIVWNQPDDLLFSVGIQIPPVHVYKLVNGDAIVVKIMFPVVAVIALYKSASK